MPPDKARNRKSNAEKRSVKFRERSLGARVSAVEAVTLLDLHEPSVLGPTPDYSGRVYPRARFDQFKQRFLNETNHIQFLYIRLAWWRLLSTTVDGTSLRLPAQGPKCQSDTRQARRGCAACAWAVHCLSNGFIM